MSDNERSTHAPVFARPGEPEPHTLNAGDVYRDAGATVRARQPVPPSGLHRVAAVGGYDGLADRADAERPAAEADRER